MSNSTIRLDVTDTSESTTTLEIMSTFDYTVPTESTIIESFVTTLDTTDRYFNNITTTSELEIDISENISSLDLTTTMVYFLMSHNCLEND